MKIEEVIEQKIIAQIKKGWYAYNEHTIALPNAVIVYPGGHWESLSMNEQGAKYNSDWVSVEPIDIEIESAIWFNTEIFDACH